MYYNICACLCVCVYNDIYSTECAFTNAKTYCIGGAVDQWEKGGKGFN